MTIDMDVKLVIDLTTSEADQDWIRIGRLKVRCEAGDLTACKQLQDMETTRLYSHDELSASKEVE